MPGEEKECPREEDLENEIEVDLVVSNGLEMFMIWRAPLRGPVDKRHSPRQEGICF